MASGSSASSAARHSSTGLGASLADWLADWGAFVGESRGYTISEGSEVEVALALQQYEPFVTFKTHPVETVGQVDELVDALLE